ncbi:MAG: hypothetical protein AAGF01_22530 [Cyanobacteria bacterium P01_G01_bin.38]
MAELTIRIPDELAERLKPLEQSLPDLLEQLVQDSGSINLAAQVRLVPNSDTLVYTEVLDFLLTRPTPQQVMGYKVSSQAQERLHQLLAKNHEASLTTGETQELDTYEQLEHFMILLKARAASQQ